MKCCKKTLKFKPIGGIQFAIEETICPTCETQYHRKINTKHTYKFINDKFVCNDCDTDITTTIVSHPIQIKNSKKKNYDEDVPYCPICEKKPQYYGKIIK